MQRTDARSTFRLLVQKTSFAGAPFRRGFGRERSSTIASPSAAHAPSRVATNIRTMLRVPMMIGSCGNQAGSSMAPLIESALSHSLPLQHVPKGGERS